MPRIAIIGCGGAGKSTLSVTLGERLSLPVFHLDRLYWKPGWVASDHQAFSEAQNKILAREKWIIDGNYGSTMESRLAAATLVLFLDLPTIVCLWGILKRRIRFRRSSRPDMTEGNRERLSLEFILYVCAYRFKRRPLVMKRLAALNHAEVVVLKSRGDIEDFLAGLEAETP